MDERADIAVVGSGAAGLFAAIWAGRTASTGGPARVVALDGAKTLGAKILVAGGGRCNVTHHAVDASAYAGASRNAIGNVLKAFDVAKTVAFFRELGVELKREETGKLFPTTDDARTVLNALLRAASDAGVACVHPCRVANIERAGAGFAVIPEQSRGVIHARRVILATGGKSLPRSGSDGAGYAIARSLGHSLTPEVFPALVPLVLDERKTFVRELSGLAADVTIELLSGTGKRLVAFTNALLCTHFGVSGPAVLDISRYYLSARRTDPGAQLVVNWLPGSTFEAADAALGGASEGSARASIGRKLAELVPERLGRALCAATGVDPATSVHQLKREERRALAHALTRTPLPVAGDRGFTYAEVTAGGVPLSEVHLGTLESRVCPGLYLCGEILDVDGRIGGFNFQWAWASGFVAGSAAGKALLTDRR